MILIASDVGTHKPPQTGLIVPMGRSGIVRTPFSPDRIGRFVINALALPGESEGQVRVQPAIVGGHL